MKRKIKKIANLLCKMFLSEAYRLKLDEKNTERKLRKELERAKASGSNDDFEWAKTEYNSEMFQFYEQREALFTRKLIKEAERLRVHIPAKPKWTYEDGFEENEDWDGMAEMYLTNKGSAKVEEEIEKKKKWRRERWAFVVQCVSAAITVIGTLSGAKSNGVRLLYPDFFARSYSGREKSGPRLQSWLLLRGWTKNQR